MRELFSVDTVCFISWLVYATSRYSQPVPLIPSLWRLNVSTGSSQTRDETLTGGRGRASTARLCGLLRTHGNHLGVRRRSHTKIGHWIPSAAWCRRTRHIGLRHYLEETSDLRHADAVWIP